ncbi:MAG: PD-(D/E)XK nuclease family protein [Sedimentisphaerales bacterium]|nr:PD-(D/E)XK nuclease family protein [Sedimentisphaerales bacterium]
MAIRFILGTSGSGKTRWCIDAIAEALRQPDDRPLVFLVPEQATFQVERAILSSPGIAGYNRLNVLSFNRLQFWLCRTDASGELSTLGRQMLVRQALSMCSGRLTLLRDSAASAGMAAATAELIGRLHEDNCDPDYLADVARRMLEKDPASLSGRKFADIAAVFKTYTELLSRPECDFINPDAVLTHARMQVKESPFLNHARLWIDGFSGFTLQQRDVLFEMLSVCSEASIALCLDPQAFDLNLTDAEQLDPSSLFAPTERTYVDLLTILRHQKMPMSEPVALTQHPRFKTAPALAQIENQYFAVGVSQPVSGGGAVELRGCSDARAEAFFAARAIRRLVRGGRYRYRELAVIVPQMDLYAHYLTAAFEQYQIPFFLDRPQTLRHHPLMELLTAALTAIQEDFAAPRMTALLKTELNGLNFRDADLLDNACRAFGIGPADWLSEQPWELGDDDPLYDAKRIHAIRKQFFEPLHRLSQQLAGTISASHCCAAIYDYLELLRVRQWLTRQAKDDSQDTGAHRHVWKKLNEAFEELQRIFAGLVLPVKEWLAILLEVLGSLTLKQIPATLDQVLIGSIERSRHPDIKVVFLIGATGRLFPMPLAGDAILTEQDAKAAAKENLHLTQRTEQALEARRYLTYIALTRASDKLYMTYPLLDENASPNTPWPGLQRLCSLFTDVRVQYGDVQDSSPLKESPSAMTQWLCAALGADSNEEESTKDQCRDVLSLCKIADQPVLQKMAAEVEYALAFRNAAELDPAIAKTWFTWPMTASETRLTTFAACPYKHFARYILNLKKRDLLRLEPVDIGEFYHDILQRLFSNLFSDGLDWTAVSSEDLVNRCRHIASEFLSEDIKLSAFIRQSRHNAYIMRQAVQRLCYVLPTMAALSAAGRFRQCLAEQTFGKDSPVAIQVEPGKKLHLQGRIDRVDWAELKGIPTGIVLDYKTSPQQMKWKEFAHGLDLQLAVYLLAMRYLTVNGKPIAKAAGAFYLPIETKYLPAKFEPADDQPVGPVLKARGIFDAAIAFDLDSAVGDDNRRSRYFTFLLKEGEPLGDYGRSDAVTSEAYSAVLAYAEQTLARLAQGIASGDIRAYPYRLGTQSPCPHCDYRCVCKFDWQLNDYHILPSIGKMEFLDSLSKGALQ